MPNVLSRILPILVVSAFCTACGESTDLRDEEPTLGVAEQSLEGDLDFLTPEQASALEGVEAAEQAYTTCFLNFGSCEVEYAALTVAMQAYQTHE